MIGSTPANMQPFSENSSVVRNLKALGYEVRCFSKAAEAADYLNHELDQVTIGIGGSATVKEMKLFELLSSHNTVYWHWTQEPDRARLQAMTADIYLTSVNALAETGEMVNIDGNGNRLAGMLYGHKKVCYVIGKNKLTDGLASAIDRARNVAAPKRAKQLGRKTPCALKADHCYHCQSPDRVCRGLLTLLGPMCTMPAEVLLINEDLGL